jgi:DNA-binding protein H-NS
VPGNRLELSLGEAAFDQNISFKKNSSGFKKMKPHDLKSMSIDELWSLHEFVSAELARKIRAETARLNQRLRQLGLDAVPHNVEKMSDAARPYPQVFPKYRNPTEPSETWAGRGRKPRWLTAQLESGKQIDDFQIDLATMPTRSSPNAAI